MKQPDIKPIPGTDPAKPKWMSPEECRNYWASLMPQCMSDRSSVYRIKGKKEWDRRVRKQNFIRTLGTIAPGFWKRPAGGSY